MMTTFCSVPMTSLDDLRRQRHDCWSGLDGADANQARFVRFGSECAPLSRHSSAARSNGYGRKAACAAFSRWEKVAPEGRMRGFNVEARSDAASAKWLSGLEKVPRLATTLPLIRPPRV